MGRDITNHKLLYLKAALFLLAGTLCIAIVLLEHPELKIAILMLGAIWCFARAYYFVFYVIEHYVDGEYRFAGLFNFVCYLWKRRGNDPER